MDARSCIRHGSWKAGCITKGARPVWKAGVRNRQQQCCTALTLDLTLHPDGAGLCLSRCGRRLVQPARAQPSVLPHGEMDRRERQSRRAIGWRRPGRRASLWSRHCPRHGGRWIGARLKCPSMSAFSASTPAAGVCASSTLMDARAMRDARRSHRGRNSRPARLHRVRSQHRPPAAGADGRRDGCPRRGAQAG
jgi:hypothetical protein